MKVSKIELKNSSATSTNMRRKTDQKTTVLAIKKIPKKKNTVECIQRRVAVLAKSLTPLNIKLNCRKLRHNCNFRKEKLVN